MVKVSAQCNIKNQSIEEEDPKDKAVGYQKIATNGAVDGDCFITRQPMVRGYLQQVTQNGNGGGGIAST